MTEKEIERGMKALASGRRLAILKLLKSKQKASVGVIATAIKLSLKATSKHLIILTQVDMVEKEQIRLNVFYRVTRDKHVLLQSILKLL